MNAFLRNVEARILAEREERMAEVNPRTLPAQRVGKWSTGTGRRTEKEALNKRHAERYLALMDDGLSPEEIRAELGWSYEEFRSAQRRAWTMRRQQRAATRGGL